MGAERNGPPSRHYFLEDIIVQLIRLKCSNCSAELELVPGTDRVICEYCGASYLIQRDREAPAAGPRRMAASNDNPVRVKLISQNVRYASLGVAFPKRSDNGWMPRYYNGYSDLNYDRMYTKLMDRLRLFAAQSYATGERYDVLAAHIYTDFHLLYHKKYNGENEKPTIPMAKDISAYSAGELAEFAEPEKIWPYHSLDILDKQIDKEPERPKQDNAACSKKLNERIDALIRTYGMDERRTVRYRAVELAYKKIPLFGKEKELKRLWLEQYTDVCLTIAMTPDKAVRVLTEAQREALDRIKKNRAVGEIAGELVRELDAIAEVQLSTRVNHDVTFEADNFSADLHVQYLHERNRRTYRKEVPFKKYGMNPTPSWEILQCVVGALWGNMADIQKRTGNPVWGVQALKDRDYGNPWDFDCILRCEVKAEGVYQDW